MDTGRYIRLLRTGAKISFFALFRPFSCDRPLTSRRLHSVFFLLPLLVIFAHAPVAQGECWVTGTQQASDIAFAPFDFEYSRSPLEALDRQSQIAIQTALSIMPTGCMLTVCKQSPDFVVYYNNISPPLPQEYFRSAGCEWTCLPNNYPPSTPPNRLSAASVSLHSVRTVDSSCGVSSVVVKLSNDASPPASGDLVDVEPGKVTTTLRAKAYDSNNQPVPNVNVKLEVTVYANSGGHGHTDSIRPKGLLSGNGQVGIEIVGNTGSDGLPFTFTAPAPAGDHKITASCTDPGRTCTQEGPDKVWVGVKDLQPIGAGPWGLVGQDSVHPSNHYLTSAVYTKIANLALAYRRSFPLSPTLRLNDASLVRGGLFDIAYPARTAFWTPPHQTHRRGTDIDVQANEFVHADAMPHGNYFEFERLARVEGCNAGLHGEFTRNQHYHVACN